MLDPDPINEPGALDIIGRMKIDPAALYLQLANLIETMPDLDAGRPYPPETMQWLGRAEALVRASGDASATVAFHHKAQTLGDAVLGRGNAHAIRALLYGALAQAELSAPAAAQGTFIAAGDTFTAFAAVAKVFQRAKRQLLLVDKWAEPSILTDFAVTAPEGVEVRILTALKEARRVLLRPAVERWQAQFASARPIVVRMAQPALLHDRLILVDETEAWVLQQSFNHLAEATHTSISRTDAELAAAKAEAYSVLWDGAEPL